MARTVPRIELRQLAHFVLACQNPTITETARAIGIAPSALSLSLHTLESELQMKLFLRKGGYLSPLPAAFWLFQEATPILHAERFAGTALTVEPATLERLQVRLDLSFSIGRFSKAISRAIETMGRQYPGLLIEFRFQPSGQPEDASLLSALPAEQMAHIALAYGSEAAIRVAPSQPFHDDAWFAVSSAEAAAQPGKATSPLGILKMRPPVVDAIIGYAERHGLRNRLMVLDAEPADLASLMAEFPQVRFLMPRSIVADRLGLVRAHLEPLDPPLISPIGVTISGALRARAETFVACLRQNLEETEANVVFDPVLTARQIHYFNLTHHCGGISAAARAAHVTQPSVSSQIQKMEKSLDRPLLERRRGGVVMTPAGERLLAMTLAIESRLGTVQSAARDIASHTQATVAIGVLPSSGHDSVMTDKVAQALTAARRQHPHLRLRLIEGSNGFLHDQIRSGDLNLAIVGVVEAQMARIHVGHSERLSIIANPDLKLAGRTEMALAEICALPLVLGTRHLSIHQAFIAAAAARHLRVETVMEVGSLPLAIALVRRAPIATVLPVSSVQDDVRQGKLTATPITEDVISSNLSVIFSAERTLSEWERSIIQSFVAVFGKGTG